MGLSLGPQNQASFSVIAFQVVLRMLYVDVWKTYTSTFPTYHPLYITLSLVILTAVANIISFLISSYRGFGIRCASGCHRLLWLVSVCHPMLTPAKHLTMKAPKKKQSPQPETNSEYVHVSGFAGAVNAL